MADVSVEKYRKNTTTGTEYNDTDTIQRAVYALKDGDTLFFNASRTYTLDAPVNLTLCTVDDEDTGTKIINKTRKFITIDGRGCTVRSSDDFKAVYNVPEKAFFFVSDDQRHGLEHSVIENFIFRWDTTPGVEIGNSGSPFKDRNAAIGIISTDTETAPEGHSVYFSKGVIRNCEFHKFGAGIHLDGENVIIEQCLFDYCYRGINSDCTKQLDVRLNHFNETTNCGLLLNNSFRSNAYGNHFFRCKNAAISVSGPQNNLGYENYLTVNIYSNKIFGEKNKDDQGNSVNVGKYVGIQCNGVKDVVIRDNFIRSMSTNSEDTYGTCGIGILLTGNNEGDNVRTSERVIITGNVINNCQIGGIKVDKSSSCKVSGNSLHSGVNGDGIDYGILISNNAGDIHVSDNALYYFSKDRAITPNKYNVKVSNNTYFDEGGKFDPLAPERYIGDTWISEEDPSVICMPELLVDLSNDEYFFLYVPEEYNSVTGISYVSYNGMGGLVV